MATWTHNSIKLKGWKTLCHVVKYWPMGITQKPKIYHPKHENGFICMELYHSIIYSLRSWMCILCYDISKVFRFHTHQINNFRQTDCPKAKLSNWSFDEKNSRKKLLSLDLNDLLLTLVESEREKIFFVDLDLCNKCNVDWHLRSIRFLLLKSW